MHRRRRGLGEAGAADSPRQVETLVVGLQVVMETHLRAESVDVVTGTLWCAVVLHCAATCWFVGEEERSGVCVVVCGSLFCIQSHHNGAVADVW